jgi:hypothetical protein
MLNLAVMVLPLLYQNQFSVQSTKLSLSWWLITTNCTNTYLGTASQVSQQEFVHPVAPLYFSLEQYRAGLNPEG